MERLGLSPGEARALLISDYNNGWLSVDKAVKGKNVSSPVRGTKSGKPKRLPVDDVLASWIDSNVDRSGRFRREPLSPKPAHWPSMGSQGAPARLGIRPGSRQAAADLVYEGTKHSFATDAIRRGVPERALQRFLGHASVVSTRRYARLADNALVEVLRPSEERERQGFQR